MLKLELLKPPSYKKKLKSNYLAKINKRYSLKNFIGIKA